MCGALWGDSADGPNNHTNKNNNNYTNLGGIFTLILGVSFSVYIFHKSVDLFVGVVDNSNPTKKAPPFLFDPGYSTDKLCCVAVSHRLSKAFNNPVRKVRCIGIVVNCKWLTSRGNKGPT